MGLSILLTIGDVITMLDLMSEPTELLILATLLLGFAVIVRRFLYQNETNKPIHTTVQND